MKETVISVHETSLTEVAGGQVEPEEKGCQPEEKVREHVDVEVPRRRLGQRLTVPVIGIGTWPMGGSHRAGDYGEVDDDTSIATLRHAFDVGVTQFDTAPTYGAGRAEELLRAALGKVRDRLFLTTKCGVYWDPVDGRWVAHSGADEVRRRLEGSLRRLGTDHVDLLLLHSLDRSRPTDEVVATLEQLRAAGSVGAYGVSNFSEGDLARYAAVPGAEVSAQQLSYHLFDRRVERSMLDTCRRLGVGVMVYGSLAHGLLSGAMTAATRFPPDDWRNKQAPFGLRIFNRDNGNFTRNVAVVGRLQNLAADLGATVSQLAIAWVLRRAEVSTALVGVRSPDEVDENLAATRLALDEAALAGIDAIMADAAGTADDQPPFSA
jgi:aryl-alcohol dehydrogenase-like predicted oxidoreductase